MEEKIKELIKRLYSKDGIERQKARHELVEIGVPVIKYLGELQFEPKQQVRWEALKALSQIAAPESIPILINALENDDFDIRWLAAEGLIHIGKSSIKPLLEAIVEKEDSIYLREGAHHILKDLVAKDLYDDDYGIINLLEKYSVKPELALMAKKNLSGI